MLLTVFYMVSTWVQGWKLTSLKSKLMNILINNVDNNSKASVMFYIKPLTSSSSSSSHSKDDGVNKNVNGNEVDENLLSSHLCNNKNIAKLKDLLWFQGDKKLCTIYPQQKVDVSGWLLYPSGKTHFPLYTDNYNQTKLSDDSKLHILIEADVEHFYSDAFSKVAKLEHYGLLLSWTADKIFATIMETDVDHLSKFCNALMEGQYFINNGLLLTRLQSVEVSGKPCSYKLDSPSLIYDRKLVGKPQWEKHIKMIKSFSSTARHVFQDDKSYEVDDLPGVIIFPGIKTLNLQLPTVLQINIDNDSIGDENEIEFEKLSVPSTPPPTPSSVSAISDKTPPNLSQSLFESTKKINTIKETDVINSETQSSTKLPDNHSDNKCSSRKNSSATNYALNYSPKKTPSKTNFMKKMTNVLIYTDSAIAKDNIESALKLILNKEKYVIYKLTIDEAKRNIWIDQANLIVVCGDVDSEFASRLIEYIVNGGKLLALCSDALHILLPSFKTAEVREHELVRFSYGKWKNIQMMHHIFCYQASPIKSRFSQDQEDTKSVVPQTPVSAEVKDKNGKSHMFQVKVLGKEETWQTPSIVLADLPSSGGRAVFSQIHLEADPSQYEMEGDKYTALKNSNSARIEILSDLLSTHLNMDVQNNNPSDDFIYTSGFFLGRHELKLDMMEQLGDKIKSDDIFETPNLKLQFCLASTKMKSPSANFLPIMLHQCPDNFSTIEYFENLKTKDIGRLVIYTDIMKSSMHVTNDCELYNGLVVIARQQTQAFGRNNNIWLSPKGASMFTLQLHIPLNSYIGQHIPILQHLVATSIISAVKSTPGYENIDLRLKWPNDIYLGDKIKIGGLIVKSSILPNKIIANLGVGVNLSNKSPTYCINDIITKYNEENKTKLATFSYEKFLAIIFNEIENLYHSMQNEELDRFYQLYYDNWLHTDAEVSVVSEDGSTKDVKIMGIDSYGYLEVADQNGKITTVQPDGNSFDFFKGLIAPSTLR